MPSSHFLSCVANAIGTLLINGGAGLVVAQAAPAPAFPIDGIYGSGQGCEIYSEHGMAAILGAGGTFSFASDGAEPEKLGGQEDAEDIVLTSDRVVGPDWLCEPATIDGNRAALTCVTDGATWIPMPVATLQPLSDSLTFTLDDEPTVQLRKCEP